MTVTGASMPGRGLTTATSPDGTIRGPLGIAAVVVLVQQMGYGPLF